jgi:RNase H-fold protein (predicted Holliday junction resolvase)
VTIAPLRRRAAYGTRRIGAAIGLACAVLAGPASGAAAGEAATAATATAATATAATATQRAVPATPGNLTREEKRCNASVRRVDRHKEKLAETRRAIGANRAAGEGCADARACERTAHRGKTLAARERNEERQLERLEAEARALCDVAAAAARHRPKR